MAKKAKPNRVTEQRPRDNTPSGPPRETPSETPGDQEPALGDDRLVDLGNLPLARAISVGVLVLAIVVIGALFFRVMANFFVPLFLAALLVVIFRPLFQKISGKVNGRPHIASILTTICILLLVLLPSGMVAFVAAAQGADFFRRMNTGGFYQSLDRIRSQLGLDLPKAEQFRQLDQEIEALADPGSLESVQARLQAAEDLVIYLTEILGKPDDLDRVGSGSDAASEENEEDTETPRENGDQPNDQPSTEPAEEASDTESVDPDGSLLASDEALQDVDSDEDLDSDEGLDFEGDAADPDTTAGGGRRIKRSAAEELLLDLQRLRRKAEAMAAADSTDDSIERQGTREQYQQEYWELRASQRTWMQSLIGDSIGAQLRMLANPSDSEMRSVIAGAQEYLQPRVLPLTQIAGRFLFQFVIDFGILIIAVYFFFADGSGMIRTLMRLSPLDDAYEERLLLQFDQTSRAVVLATVLSALAQGALSTLGYWFFGLPSLVLLFLATTFMSFIPFLGPATIWVPAAIYLGVFEGNWGASIGLTIYGLTIVSAVDNVVRMFVLQGNSQLHPLLALLSVLGGLQVFGPIGILVGPMVVVFLQTLLEILNHEMWGKESTEQKPPPEQKSPPGEKSPAGATAPSG